jgi:hypothetical protein
MSLEDPPSLPTEDDEASIPPTEHVRDDPNLNQYPTITVRRKAAKRTFPYDLKIGETIQLALPRPQDEESPARKKQRLEESFPTSVDDAITENTLHDTTVVLPPLDAVTAVTTASDHADDIADSDPVVDMHPSARTTGTLRRWTPEEDAKLTSAVTNTCKKKRGKKFVTDWVAISAQVPGRTRNQCRNRWDNTMKFSIDATTARMGRWTTDEDKQLKNAVPAQGGKNWEVIALLVPGRTRIQCRNRWRDVLVSNIDPTTARTGKWTIDEDKQLKNAVPAQGRKNWEEIAAQVSGRTKRQCGNRWRDALDPSIDLAARTGLWTADEDTKLSVAVGAHGGKNWEGIAALVPGRTKNQCRTKWHTSLQRPDDGTCG